MRRALLLLFVAGSCLAGFGCLEGAPKVEQLPISEQYQDLSELFKEHYEAKKRSPAKLNDFLEFEASHPRGYSLLSQGEAIAVYGLSFGTGKAVLAYAKGADANGGYVVLQDGTVKQMSADEFKAAKGK